VLTLVLGGARSGKSQYAQALIRGRDAICIATPHRGVNPEMRGRIEHQRTEHAGQWITVEDAEGVPAVIRNAQPPAAPVLIDGITLWLSNLLEPKSQASHRQQQATVLAAVNELTEASRNRDVIAVSNEIGLGMIPTARRGKRFRDLHGWANQLLAANASRVVVLIAGLPLVLKDSARGESK
jgi:adenosylcobinamide kinase/adenosylcobinamide-phosphate guanylyltransferase